MEQKIITVSKNTGIGLWTSICYAFASIFGVESLNLGVKQSMVVSEANSILMDKLNKIAKRFSIVSYSVAFSGPLQVTVSAVVDIIETNPIEESNSNKKEFVRNKVKKEIKQVEQQAVEETPAFKNGIECLKLNDLKQGDEVVLVNDVQIGNHSFKTGTIGIVQAVLQDFVSVEISNFENLGTITRLISYTDLNVTK